MAPLFVGTAVRFVSLFLRERVGARRSRHAVAAGRVSGPGRGLSAKGLTTWACAWLVGGLGFGPAALPVTACPFCGVVGRSLAERRDAADIVVVGEAAGRPAVDADGLEVQAFTVVGPLRGALATGREVTARISAPVAATAVLFGSRVAAGPALESPAPGRWEAIAADESLLAHVADAPQVSEPPDRRLHWYAARLEHPNPAIAEDAFVEFGLAPFTAVRAAAPALDPRRLRDWVAEAGIDPRRKGFYGLALGLAARTTAEPAEAARCTAALRAAIAAPADDLRAGFDGLLAGLLVAEGVPGIDELADSGLLGPTTRAGDARHALAALRFAAESLADSIPPDRVAAATARLVGNPAVSAMSVIDLARYGWWESLEQVAALWDTLGREDPLVRRAVAGYLAACPLAAARARLAEIATRDRDLVRQALEAAGPR